jgi:hypothetical protein
MVGTGGLREEGGNLILPEIVDKAGVEIGSAVDVNVGKNVKVGVEDGVGRDVGVGMNVEVAVREGVLAINGFVGP